MNFFKKKKIAFKESYVQTENDNLVNVDGNKKIIKMDTITGKNYNFVNWDKNRPVDSVRVNDLHEYFIKNDIKMVPGIIYAYKTKESNDLIIYDGIHRIQAVLKNENIMQFLIQITETADEEEIKNDFININKSISVPSIYLEETSVYKKLVSISVAAELCKRYPKFLSPSRIPYQYNFNRDIFTEFISTLEIDYTKEGTSERIINELMGLNLYAKEFVKRNNIVYPKKCSFYNFFLFFLDKLYIKNQLETILNT